MSTTVTPEELRTILDRHAAWRRDIEDGERANLRYADLECVRGVNWWQGGSYGPRRRMIRVVEFGGEITVHAGCLSGTADEVRTRLSDERLAAWADELGGDAAATELTDALALIDLGVATVTRRMRAER